MLTVWTTATQLWRWKVQKCTLFSQSGNVMYLNLATVINSNQMGMSLSALTLNGTTWEKKTFTPVSWADPSVLSCVKQTSALSCVVLLSPTHTCVPLFLLASFICQTEWDGLTSYQQESQQVHFPKMSNHLFLLSYF